MSSPPSTAPSLHERVGLAFNEVQRTMFDHPFEGRVALFEAVGREFVPKLARVRALGYTDLLTKWHVLLPLVANYRRRRSVRRALGHLDPLIAELEAAEARTGEATWTDILALARELRAGLVRRGQGRRR